MKTYALLAVVLLTVGCSSPGEEKQMFFEAADACNTICKNNPEINQFSQKAGGGMPLLFLGGMEISCSCKPGS